MKNKIIILLYLAYGIYILSYKFFFPAPWMSPFIESLTIGSLLVNVLLCFFLGIFSTMIAGDGKRFGFTKSRRQALIPFLLFVGFLLSFFLLPLSSYYLQLEQGHLQADRNKAIEWIRSQNIARTEEPVTYDLPVEYAYLSIDGKIGVIQDEYYFMVEFKYRGTLDDYEHVIYVDQDDLRAPAQYFQCSYAGTKIVKFWFWYY
jgi:fluoride ion exporter CrcB/FEX